MKDEKLNTINNSSEKYNIIHEITIKKTKYFNNIIKIYEDLNKMFQNFEKILHSKIILKQNIIDNNENIHIITKKLIEIFIDITSLFQKSIEKIISNIEKYLDDIKNLQIKFNSFDEIYKLYQQKNKKVLESKNTYLESGKELEKLSIINFENNDLPSNELENLNQKTKEIFIKYKNDVNELNKYNTEYNEKQKEFFENYIKLENLYFYDSIKEEINNILEKNLKLISKAILDINTKKKLNPKKEADDNIITIFTKEIKPKQQEKIISFPTNINFENCIEEKDYLTFVKAIKYIKKNISDESIYKDFDEQKEKNRNEKRKLIESMFDINVEIADEKYKELINSINDISTQNIFILIMSFHRTISKRSKKFIDLMGECLNIIIDISKKDNNYEMIKNCVILSQTYYYLDEKDNQKIYIFQKITKNEFFKDDNFWINFIENMINIQFKIYEKNNNLIGINLSTGEGVNFNSNNNNKLSDLMFTQLLPFVNNMIDFNMDKNKIINVVKYFNDKYKYLSQKDYEAIISMISNRIKE